MSPGKGRGTTVRVELPLMIVHDAKAYAPDRVHPGADPHPTSDLNLANLTGIRVLLVDDDADAIQMARDALTFAGATVATASSANDALAALDGNTFDVAVLDIGMPQVDGYQLLKEIRAAAREPAGKDPHCGVDGLRAHDDRTRSLKASFQMHLSKPVQPTELAAAVLALTGRDGGSRRGFTTRVHDEGSRRGFTTRVHDEGSSTATRSEPSEPVGSGRPLSCATATV